MEMKLAVDNKNDKAADRINYEELYHAAFNHLTFLHNAIEKAQQDLEAMYLQQTDMPYPQ